MRRRAILSLLAGTAAATIPVGPVRASSERNTVDVPLGRARSMLEMTFPEFEAEVALTDICLLPVGAIEEHGPHLPLNADSLGALAQLGEVQAALLARGTRTIIGPILNIGITNEGADGARDGTSIYPGSLTIGYATFVALYVDLLRSLRSNGLKRIFIYSGHLGAKHLGAVAQAAREGSEAIDGLEVFALIDSERLARLNLPPSRSVLPVDQGLNFPMLNRLLGGSEPAFTTHADGWETSLMLYARPDLVRPGYAALPQISSRRFIDAQQAGDRSLNPTGIGGFPTRGASAAIGRQIAADRTRRIVAAIMTILSG